MVPSSTLARTRIVQTAHLLLMGFIFVQGMNRYRGGLVAARMVLALLVD
jgi:hypothetical protein